MKIRHPGPQLIATVAAVITTVTLNISASASIIVNDPSLPAIYPAGVYRALDPVTFNVGGSVNVVLSQIEHRVLGPVTRIPLGPDEMETFNSEMLGQVSVNGGTASAVSATGTVTTRVFGLVGNTTGTFQTEMLVMNLAGSSPFGPLMIRESPTRPTNGQTTVTDAGGGLYQIDSFFDVFTELSLDGGATWIPADGSHRVELQPVVPEPATIVSAVMLLLPISVALIVKRKQQMQ
jgi:hypothetical protein